MIRFESNKFYNAIKPWQKPLVVKALSILTDRESSSSLKMILALMVRAGKRCSSTKVFAFSTLLERGSHFLSSDETSKRTSDEDLVEDARVSLRRTLMEFIDTIKSRAFSTVFLEPAKFYLKGDHDVEIHGANFYGCVLTSYVHFHFFSNYDNDVHTHTHTTHRTLGIRCPRLIHASDWCRGGLVSYLDNGVDPVIRNTLWKDENLGKSYMILKSAPTKHVTRGKFIFNKGTPKEIANRAIEVAASRSHQRRQISKYLEQFAHYFSKAFLLEKLIVHLLRDDASLSHLCVIFRDLLCQIGVKNEDTLKKKARAIKEFLYNSETYKLDEQRAFLVLRAVGKVVRMPDLIKLTSADDRACVESFLKEEFLEEGEVYSNKNESKESSSNNKKNKSEATWILVDSPKNVKKRQLEEIARELQHAMASHDRALIRDLMRKRRDLLAAD